MCGIFGLYKKNGQIAPGVLDRAIKVLNHRGPDGSGSWLNSRKTVGIGHTRLSIIDIDGGAQPLHNEDGTVHAAINGEIYDFERIREGLIQRGHIFSTGSDSELLIHLYEEYGIEALHSMRGEFAFILWDERIGRLLAGRDRFGIKPIFYTNQNGNIYLASEIKALIAAGVPPYWDEESVHISSFMAGIPLQNRTLFKDIYQIPPGCVLTASKEYFEITKYWDFNYPTLENQKTYSESETVEKFRVLFDEAVKLRLRADVPVGVYLSGGIDSCSILGTVAKFRGKGTKAYTISFEDSEYDELAIAKEMAELTGTEFNCYRMTPDILAKSFVESVYHGETTLVNTNSVAKFNLSKHVRESGYKVVLTGEGADEILGGYAHLRQDLLLHDPDHKNRIGSRAALGELHGKNETLKGIMLADGKNYDNAISKSLGFIPSFLNPFISGAEKLRLITDKRSLAKYAHVDAYRALLDGLDVEKNLRGRHVLHQSLYVWSKLMLPNYLLTTLGDRMEMGHSIEGRLPYLDHKLVEFVVSLPTYYKIRNLQEKYLLRQALRPVISKTVYQRQKQVFLGPPTTGNRKDPTFQFLSEYVCDNARHLPYYNPAKVKLMVKMMPILPVKIRNKMDPILILLASLLALNEHFNIGLN